MSEHTAPISDPLAAMITRTDLRKTVTRNALERAQKRAQEQGKHRISLRQHPRHPFSSPDPQENTENDSTDVPLDPTVPAELQALEAHTRRSGAGWVATPGMATTRTRYRRSDSLGHVLGKFIHTQGWDQPTKLGSVMAKWTTIVGDNVAAHCVIESFDDDKLIIRCDSTAWMNQLQILLPHIERRIDEEVGSGVVKQTIVKGPTPPSWKKGKYSVPGRGPRDTYG